MSKTKKIVTHNAKELAQALGLDASVAVEWEMRYSLTQRIVEIVKRNHIKVTEIAKKAETSRARVTRILKGETTGISLDVLARVLGAVGQKAKITFRKSA
jgi:predicted XRE-type DNA-binding protein